jgi:hypothetical protein
VGTRGGAVFIRKVIVDAQVERLKVEGFYMRFAARECGSCAMNFFPAKALGEPGVRNQCACGTWLNCRIIATIK